MTAKLRIKAKGIEIEWEGEVDYLKNDLPDLIAAIVAALGISARDDDEDGDADNADSVPLDPNMTFTTAALAAKVQPKSAGELFKVALAKLQLSDKIEPAPRADIHNEMRSAAKFYQPSMRNNLNNTIDRLLTAKDINEPSKGMFALTPSAQTEIQSKM